MTKVWSMAADAMDESVAQDICSSNHRCKCIYKRTSPKQVIILRRSPSTVVHGVLVPHVNANTSQMSRSVPTSTEENVSEETFGELDNQQTVSNANSNANSNSDLPDVINQNVYRYRFTNGQSSGRRPASVCLPVDPETIREVGLSLRRLSECFHNSRRASMFY